MNHVAEVNALKVVCAWCEKLLKPGVEPISHGICPECLEIHFPKGITFVCEYESPESSYGKGDGGVMCGRVATSIDPESERPVCQKHAKGEIV